MRVLGACHPRGEALARAEELRRWSLQQWLGFRASVLGAASPREQAEASSAVEDVGVVAEGSRNPCGWLVECNLCGYVGKHAKAQVCDNCVHTGCLSFSMLCSSCSWFGLPRELGFRL